MSCSTVNYLVFFALLFSAEVGLVAGTGAISDVDTENLAKGGDMFRYAAFALETLKEKSCPFGDERLCATGDDSLKVETIKSARAQQVAGKNFHIECAVSAGAALSLSIYWRPWDKILRLDKAELTKNGKMTSLLKEPLGLDWDSSTSFVVEGATATEQESDGSATPMVKANSKQSGDGAGQKKVTEKEGEEAGAEGTRKQEKTESKEGGTNHGSFLEAAAKGAQKVAGKEDEEEEEKAAGGVLNAWMVVLLVLMVVPLVLCAGGLFLFWQRATASPRALSGGLTK